MESTNVNNTEVKSMDVTGSGKGLIVAAAIGGVILVSGVVYKFVIKPLAAKHRAKKNAATSESDAPVEV